MPFDKQAGHWVVPVRIPPG